MIKAISLTVLFAFFLHGCATTNPGNGASINYYLPKTEATVTFKTVLNQCPEVDKNVLLMTKVVLELNAGKQYPVRTISGIDLASFKTKRTLTVSVNEQGVISGLNSVNADKTATIISNIGKLGVGISGLVSSQTAIPSIAESETTLFHYICNETVKNYLDQIENLRKKIRDKKNKLYNITNSESSKELQNDINALAFNIAQIKQDHLTQSLVYKLPLNAIESEVVDNKPPLILSNLSKLKPWFGKA